MAPLYPSLSMELRPRRTYKGAMSTRTVRLEERIAKLEAQVAQLELRLPKSTTRASWVDSVFGLCRDDPEFEEMVRLGQEYRKAQVPDYAGDDVSA